jgi:hypothetical protein
MGTFSLGGGKEVSSTRSKVRLDSDGGGSVSFFYNLDKDDELFSLTSISFLNELGTGKELCSSRPCTTKGLDNSKYCHT